jgi:hypothetical protein
MGEPTICTSLAITSTVELADLGLVVRCEFVVTVQELTGAACETPGRGVVVSTYTASLGSHRTCVRHRCECRWFG